MRTKYRLTKDKHHVWFYDDGGGSIIVSVSSTASVGGTRQSMHKAKARTEWQYYTLNGYRRTY
jgi:hypothetical protein